jgi:hypothetical protein
MPSPPVSDATSVRFKAAIERCLQDGYAPFRMAGGRGSSVQRGAKALCVHPARLQSWLLRQMRLQTEGKPHFVPDWSMFVRTDDQRRTRVTVPRTARRWLLTAAQNDTRVHEKFWTNLQAYAQHVGAQILIGPFTY